MPKATPQQEAWTQGYDAAEAHYRPLVERQRDRAEKAEGAVLEAYGRSLYMADLKMRATVNTIGEGVFGPDLWAEHVRLIEKGEL